MPSSAPPPGTLHVLAGKVGARKEVGAVAKSKDKRRKVRRDKETARQTSELISAVARLVRAVGVLADALGRWFN